MTLTSIERRQCIPIIFTRGSHYDVGFDVGRNFKSIIHSFLKSYKPLHEDFLPAYETPQGREAYESTLNCVKENFPQYVDELQGTADGANAPFHHLFMLHLDNIILANTKQPQAGRISTRNEPVGCSSIMLNDTDQMLLGHTEDAVDPSLNHFYIVSAHIVSDQPRGRWGVTEERWTSLCYAGHLPGYTMGFNQHGLVYSINTLSARNLHPGHTPRHILARALLSAQSLNQVKNILQDKGCGAADGCSINLTFINVAPAEFYNIEMAPVYTRDEQESQLDILKIENGQFYEHCNSYIRMGIKECNFHMTQSSISRMKTFKQYSQPKNEIDIHKMLGDESHLEYPVFRRHGIVKTIAVGIFDCNKKTWSLYSDNPKDNDPIVVLPL